MTVINLEVVTYACYEHKHQVFDTVKWHLVNKGLWYPDGLSLEALYSSRIFPSPFSFEVKKCFCGKPASHIIKYKLPLKVKKHE